MKYIATIYLILNFCIHPAAQLSKREAAYIKSTAPCGGMDSVLSRKGNWKKVDDDDVFPDKTFPRSQFKLVNSRIDSIFKLFKESITDCSGFEPKWYRGIRGGSYTMDGPVPYTFTSLYFNYYCNSNTGKMSPGDETWNWYHVFVNHYNWFCTKLGDWDYKGDGKKIMIFLLPPKVGTWKGRTLYAPLIPKPNTRAVVLSHNKKLPWHSLSRKEYLLGLKYHLREVQLKYSYPNAQKEMDEIDAYIANSTEESLKQPAVVPARNGLRFNGKWEDEEQGGSRVVVFSSTYWNDNLPRYAAQFMILFWYWDDDPVSLSIKKQYEENFPLEKLKALVDK